MLWGCEVSQDKRKLKKKAWKLLATCIRQEKPRCEVCKVNPTTEVHHIVLKARGNVVYFLERNLLAVCATCHTGFHRRWSPEEIEQAVVKTKGDFSDVEQVKWNTLKYSVSDYERMIAEYTERLTK